MAKKLEEHLYRSALTKEEYIDQSTLKKRLQMIAHGLGVPKPSGGNPEVARQQNQQEQTAIGQNDQIGRLAQLQAQAPSGDAFGLGRSDDAKSSQAQYQLNLLKQQQQQQQQQQQVGSASAGAQQGSNLSKEARLQQLQQQEADEQNAGSSMMENLNQLLMKQRQQQEEVKQHEQLKQKQAQQLAAQQAGVSPMTPLALQQMLNQKSKPSHPAIEQLQKNLRQASQPQQQQPSTFSTGIPPIDATMSLNDAGDLSAVTGNSSDRLAEAQRKKVTRQQQKRLVLLRHASKCTQGPSCKTKFCPQMVALWKHMKKCRDKDCKTSHCLSSRCVLNHYRICKSKGKTSTCEICAPVMKDIRCHDASASGQVDDQTDELSQEGSRGILSGTSSPTLDIQQPNGARNLAEFQAAQQKLQQQQLLLQQLQQQQAQLLEQQKQLQQQQQQVLPQTQQGQQLQQQRSLLQKLQQEFQQQQQLLQYELQRQSLILQQGQRVQMERQMQSSALSALENRKRKVGIEESGKHLSKIAKNMTPKPRKNKRLSESAAERQPKMKAHKPGNGEPSYTEGKRSEKVLEGTLDTFTSLIPSMTTASIIAHLDSLQGGICLTPKRIGQRCLPLVRKLINDPCGWVFCDAVDPVELGLSDYFDVVKHPMHLAKIEEKLEDGAYKDMESFEKDVHLVFDNAIVYNGEESDVGEMASDILKSFERDFAAMQKCKSNVHFLIYFDDVYKLLLIHC